MVAVSHRWNNNGVHAMLTAPNGAVAQLLLRKGKMVETAAKRNLRSNPTRVNSGRLLNSIQARLVRKGSAGIACDIGTDVFYAQFVHDGTGIYGPRSRRIEPVSRKVLKWSGRRGDTYSMWSNGMAPNPFLRNALRAAAR
jgi:hypothetical protein